MRRGFSFTPAATRRGVTVASIKPRTTLPHRGVCPKWGRSRTGQPHSCIGLRTPLLTGQIPALLAKRSVPPLHGACASVLAAATAAAVPVLVLVSILLLRATAAALPVLVSTVLMPVTTTAAFAALVLVLMLLMRMPVLVMLAVGVDMTMANLILTGGAGTKHFDIENQILPGERMVAIEKHLIALDTSNCNNRGMAVAIGLEHVADIDLLHRQLAARHAAHQRVVTFAIRLLGGNHDHPLGSHSQARECLFQAIDDLPHALQILDGLAADGGVEQLSLMVAQRVVEGNDGAGHAL